MDFSDPPRKPRAESIVPMINVVFLLLIFFLMTSRLAQPDPFDLSLPESALDSSAEGAQTLYVDKTGKLFFDGIEGDAALTALTKVGSTTDKLVLRADAALPATDMAKLMAQLASTGVKNVELMVTPK